MDIFGIGHAMKAMSHVYFQSARRSGRTTMMIDSLKEGDRVVFANQREADRVKRLIQERGLKYVRCLVCQPADVHDLRQFGTSQGRTMFDHTLVESLYLNAVHRCEQDIDYMQNDLSGYGEPHRETRRQAIEAQKWNI